MLKPAQTHAFILATAALLLFYLAYFHHQKMKANQPSHIATPGLNTNEKIHAPVNIIIEYKMTLIIYGLSTLLALISLILVLRDRQKNAGSRHFLPLVFLPLGIIITITTNAYRTGLFSF